MSELIRCNDEYRIYNEFENVEIVPQVGEQFWGKLVKFCYSILYCAVKFLFENNVPVIFDY